MSIQAAIIDIDMTLVDSSISENTRKQRNWSSVYSQIPEYFIHPQILRMMTGLRDKRIKIAIVSSSPRPYCERVLSHFQIPYDALVAYHDTQQHKPYPQPFQKALALINSDPTCCLSLGDDLKDIVAAKSTGIGLNVGCVWYIDNTKELISSGVDMILTTPIEVLSLIN